MKTLIFIGILLVTLLANVIFKQKKEKIKTKQEGSIVDNPTINESTNKLIEVREVLLKSSSGQELIFKKDKIISLREKKYTEVPFAQVNQGAGTIVKAAMPILQQSFTAEKIAEMAPNGLFTTLANPETLSKFSDGSFSTMVRGANNKLISHEGFSKVVDITKGNPIIAITVGMQAMAMISGQYYLHEINTKLEKISGKLDELMNVHNDEKIGILLTVQQRLAVIAGKEHADSHDINEIRSLIKASMEVSSEYKLRLTRQLEELRNLKPKNIFEKNKIATLQEKSEETDFTIKIIYQADQLAIQAELLEISVRMQLGDNVEITKELMIQLEEHYKKSFLATMDSFINDEYCSLIQNKYQELGKKYISKNPDYANQISNSLNLIELEKENSNAEELIQRLMTEFSKKREMIYIPGDNANPQRVFVETE